MTWANTRKSLNTKIWHWNSNGQPSVKSFQMKLKGGRNSPTSASWISYWKCFRSPIGRRHHFTISIRETAGGNTKTKIYILTNSWSIWQHQSTVCWTKLTMMNSAEEKVNRLSINTQIKRCIHLRSSWTRWIWCTIGKRSKIISPLISQLLSSCPNWWADVWSYITWSIILWRFSFWFRKKR